MGFVKCFDVVSMVVEEANNQFGVTWNIDKEKERDLKRVCVNIDFLSDEFNGVAFEVDINEITMDITVSLICAEIIVENASHRLFDVLKCTKRFAIKPAEDLTNTQIDFVFPGIWERSY